MKLLVIYNPNAAHRRAQKLLPEVKDAFRRKGIQADLLLTERPGHAVELARQAALSDYDGLVAAGGDGTLFEVLNGYYANPSPQRIPLGVLPTGTGNAFARDLELDAKRWPEAVEVLALGRTRWVDVGRFSFDGKQRYYLNILGLGFVADVTFSAGRLKALGNVAYTLGVVLQTLFLHSYAVRLEADGRILERENLFAEISNTRYTSNFLMAPRAKIDDGLLDVTLLGRMSRQRLLKCFPLIFTGEHLKLPEVETFQARSIRISTDAPKVLTPDGELEGSTPVEVECLKREIEVLWK